VLISWLSQIASEPPKLSFTISTVPLYTDSGTDKVIFSLNPSAGQSLYLQLMQQIRLALDTGVLQHGDQLPGIRTLAEQLVVSHNTVAKAYSQLEHEGLLELRHGSGAFVTAKRGRKSRSEKVLLARSRIQALIESLRNEGLSDEEIHRLCEAELFYPATKIETT